MVDKNIELNNSSFWQLKEKTDTKDFNICQVIENS